MYSFCFKPKSPLYYRCNVWFCGVNTTRNSFLSPCFISFLFGEDLSDAIHDNPVDQSFSSPWESEPAHHRRELAIRWSSGGTALSLSSEVVRSLKRWISKVSLMLYWLVGKRLALSARGRCRGSLGFASQWLGRRGVHY